MLDRERERILPNYFWGNVFNRNLLQLEIHFQHLKHHLKNGMISSPWNPDQSKITWKTSYPKHYKCLSCYPQGNSWYYSSLWVDMRLNMQDVSKQSIHKPRSQYIHHLAELQLSQWRWITYKTSHDVFWYTVGLQGRHHNFTDHTVQYRPTKIEQQYCLMKVFLERIAFLTLVVSLEPILCPYYFTQV